MSYQYIVDHIPKSQQMRPGYKMKPTYGTIHSTGNPKSTAKNERDWLSNPSNKRIASWHVVIDESRAIEAIPLDEVAYHAGNRAGNYNSWGVEMVESGNRDMVLYNTARFVVDRMKKDNLTLEQIVRHFDWSGKNCPRILSANNWEGWKKFKAMVEIEMKGGPDNMTEMEVIRILNQQLKPDNNLGAGEKQPAHWSDPFFAELEKSSPGVFTLVDANGNPLPTKGRNVITRGEVAKIMSTFDKNIKEYIDSQLKSQDKLK